MRGGPSGAGNHQTRIAGVGLLGVGMIVALILDASIVRVLLVPAVMRLPGSANWWAPGPLRRLYARYGLREAGQESGNAESHGGETRSHRSLLAGSAQSGE